MSQLKRYVLIALLLLLVWPAPPGQAQLDPQATVTISGTVNGPGGEVAGAWIGIGSPVDWRDTVTDASGAYTVTIETDGPVWFHIRPDEADRLSQINQYRDGVTASFTQNFTVTNGYLLDLGLLDQQGALLTEEVGLEIVATSDILPDSTWYQLDPDGGSRYRAVLPPDVYHVTARNVPDGYYRTGQSFDLRSADQTVTMTLHTTYVHPIPYEPPDASRITIGPSDDLGEATVTGTAGAALPLAHVLLVNLHSAHQAHAVSQADGSFSATIYAPPGSAIMLKHGPADGRWRDLETGVAEMLNPYPGTIIHLPHIHTADRPRVPFAAAGGIEVNVDDTGETPNTVGAGWALTGTLGPTVVDGAWTQVLTGTYDGATVPGLTLGGLNWTHPALGDLDADGDLELVVGERAGRLVLYRNLGTASVPDWQFEQADFAGVDTGDWAYPALVDVTADGALDLFVGAGDGTVSIYHNAGTPDEPTWPAYPDQVLSAGPAAAPALDDIDDDGDLDLLVGYEGAQLTHFENTGTITTPVWTEQTTAYAGIDESAAGNTLQPAFIDLDGDDDQDLLLGRGGTLIWYQRGGTPAVPTWTRQDEDPIGYGGGSSATSPAVGNWSGTDAPDVVTGEHWGGLRFFVNGAPWIEEPFSLPFELAGDTAPALTDWDDDGDLDMLVGQVHGEVHQYTNVGTAAAPDWRPDGITITLPWTDHPHAFPTFADIDGDDDADLFIGEGGWPPDTGMGGNIHHYENTGSPTSPNWTLVVTDFLGIDVGGWSTPAFVDIDADADLDLFIGDEAGTLTFVENTGTPTSPAWAAPVHPYADLQLPPYSAPAFLDLDQDGLLDILVGQAEGSLSVVRNTGTVTTPTWELVSTIYPPIDVDNNSLPAAGDLDDDGLADLMVGTGDGGLQFYRYDGPGAPPAPGDAYTPGDPFTIDGTLRLHSPAITATTDVGEISVISGMALLALFDAEGQPVAGENYFMSTMLTPTGLPIQRVERAEVGVEGTVEVSNLRHAGGHAVAGDVSFDGRIPADLPPGTYRPVVFFDVTGVPTTTEWVAAHVVQNMFFYNQAPLPPLTVAPASTRAESTDRRLIWQLLMDDFVQGTHGTGAREDEGAFELAPQIVSQGAPYATPPVDLRTGQPITYRLEPFLPMISWTDRRMPTPPLLPFDLPGGELCVAVQPPGGVPQDLGCEPFAQSFNRTKTTRGGDDLNGGTVQLDDVYSLMATSDRFRTPFNQYGHHVVTMTGTISDLWGTPYTGGGTYDLWIAQPLDIDPGVLPGTPLAVGDAFNPAMQLTPPVPAQVALTVTLYPDSDPAQAVSYTRSGRANDFGYFDGAAATSPISMPHAGEYRVDVTAAYTTTDGALHMGTMTWGGVVMTPEAEAQLVAHGRRGLDSLPSIPSHWFLSSDLPIPEGAVSHSLNPYYNGDLLWSRMSDGAYGGDSLLLGASVHDPVGDIETAIWDRADQRGVALAGPGGLEERFDKDEIPLFISTRSDLPAQLLLDQVGGDVSPEVDQIAYSYRSSQRPGVRVREVVAEDGQSGGYWRLDTLYDDQLGVGVLGDQVNDFKFQYVGAVFRDLESGHSEYAGQGSGWVFIPDDDPTGSRVMPPFAGFGAWDDRGGPIMTLLGEEIDIFILPTGTRPGAVLETGDVLRFAGHVMPTLDSQVAFTVTAPSGATHSGGGQANEIGYFYDPEDDLVVDEAGVWTIDVRVWHEGRCSGGALSPPYPTGDVLGSQSGRYPVYVVPHAGARLNVSTPTSGFLTFGDAVSPITITGTVPTGLTGTTVDYTIAMPGFILERGQVPVVGDSYELVFDPAALHEDFPNLDLVGRDTLGQAGLADTFTIGLLLRGQVGETTVERGNRITLQGEEVFVSNRSLTVTDQIYLPLTIRGE